MSVLKKGIMLMKFQSCLLVFAMVVGLQAHSQSTPSSKVGKPKASFLPPKRSSSARSAQGFSSGPALSTSQMTVEAPGTANNDAMSSINYFPKSGVKVLTLVPTVANGNLSRNLKTETQSLQVNTFTTAIGFQTRLSEAWAIEISNTFGNEDVSQSSRVKGVNQNSRQNMRSSGLGDFHVIAKTKKSQGAGQLHLSADLGLSTTNSEVGSNSTDGNRSTGGMQLAPGLSYEQYYRAQVIGWKANINLRGKRSVEQRVSAAQPKEKYTIDGGNTLSALVFTEWQAKRNIVGIRGGVSFIGGESLEQSGRSSTSIDPYQLLSAGLYGEAIINSRVTLVPALTFSTLLSRSTGTVDAYDSLGIAVGARIAL
jgi:hypothetical protein